MSRSKSLVFLFSLLALFSIVLGACQPQVVEKTVEVVKTVEVEKAVEKTVVVEVEKENPAANYKLAVILPGVITDADYNTLGYVAATTVQTELGVEMAYSEAVPVPDAERVMREYLDQGFNIIFTHGNQFNKASLALAEQFPDVTFVVENDGKIDNAPANVWVIDRNFHYGYYVIGYIAARASKTGKIGYIGGLTLPFSYQEVHAIEQALKDNNLTVDLKPVWTGDFNDPTKGRQVADEMIADGRDVIMGSMNLGMFGLFEAAKAASSETKKILVTAKYTDKTNFAKDNYITSSLYDFASPLKEVVSRVIAGEKGGYVPIEFGKGTNIQQPLKNVPPELDAEVTKLVEDIKSGKIVVNRDSTEIK
jgi:basic membrane protein A